MESKEIREYRVQKKAKNIAQTPWLILPGENKETRRLVQISFIRDSKETNKFVGLHLDLLFQKRKSLKENWPSKAVDLRKVKNNFGFKFSLDSIQTYELFEILEDSYPIGLDSISSGARTVIRGAEKDEIIITEKNKIEILKKLSKALSEEDINKWLRENISSISKNLALVRIYNERKKILNDFATSLAGEHDEDYWRNFFISNRWIFGASNIAIIGERRIDIHHQTDLPFEVEGGFMDIIEIKKPTFPFWIQSKKGGNYLYREKFLIPNSELQGAIAQTSKYILQAEKNVNNADYIRDHNNVIPLKPRGLIVHGRSIGWFDSEWEAFRLLNDRLHGIQIVTFDHLLERAKKVLNDLEVESQNIDELEEVDVADIPF